MVVSDDFQVYETPGIESPFASSAVMDGVNVSPSEWRVSAVRENFTDWGATTSVCLRTGAFPVRITLTSWTVTVTLPSRTALRESAPVMRTTVVSDEETANRGLL